MRNFFRPKEVSPAWEGQERENAYASILHEFHAKVVGGLNDNGGDIKLDHPEIPVLQVKTSWEYAKDFLKESLRRKKFIPIAVGEPGSSKEMIDSILKFGGWIDRDEPDREKKLDGIAKIRTLCYAV